MMHAFSVSNYVTEIYAVNYLYHKFIHFSKQDEALSNIKCTNKGMQGHVHLDYCEQHGYHQRAIVKAGLSWTQDWTHGVDYGLDYKIWTEFWTEALMLPDSE